MGEVLSFQCDLRRRRPPFAGGGEIVFFPGVRYEPLAEPAKPNRRKPKQNASVRPRRKRSGED